MTGLESYPKAEIVAGGDRIGILSHSRNRAGDRKVREVSGRKKASRRSFLGVAQSPKLLVGGTG
jgi:hypothetical protein